MLIGTSRERPNPTPSGTNYNRRSSILTTPLVLRTLPEGEIVRFFFGHFGINNAVLKKPLSRRNLWVFCVVKLYKQFIVAK